MEPRKFLKEQTPHDTTQGHQSVYYGEVIDTDDPNDTQRIRVRLKGLDDRTTDENLPYCEPLLPKMLNIMPKVGECVRILLADARNPQLSRLWIGPVISQPQKLKKDPYKFTALSGSDTRFTNPDTAPSNIPEAAGVYPAKEDVALQGRDNSDIILAEKQVQIRAGKSEVGDPLKANKKNPAEILVRISVDGGESYINLSADNFNFISPKGQVTKSPSHSDSEQKEMVENLFSMLYGERVVELFKLFQGFVAEHVHGYHGKPPVVVGATEKILNYNLDALLNKNIRSN